jgi:N-acylneuraminate cytidylyltransferase
MPSGALAIIPARGGSQRVPHKNIRDFAGKPMLAWSIEAALESGLFARVVVSTDDDAIAQAAERCGAEVPFRRPATLADHHTPLQAVMTHALQALGDTPALPPFACLLMATAPFVRAQDLQRGFEQLERSDAAYAFAVTDYAYPVQRALRLDAAGRIEMLQPEHRLTRSQDLEPAFHDAAQFYWGRTEAWLRGDAVLSPASLPVHLPRERVQDIDTPDDWHRAELMHAALRQAGVA